MTPSKKSGLYEQPTGSPSSGEPVFLVIGKLRRPHGVHGEIIMDIFTDFPERIHPGITFYVGENHRPLVLRSCRQHQNSLLLAFEAFQNRDEVGALRNQWVYVHSVDRPSLPEGDFYHHQILGLKVIDEKGNILGTVIEILETGANDVLVVRPTEGADILIPVVDSVVRNIDLGAGEILVQLIPGIFAEG
jgi:16S rRNA processing protein RimM